MDIEGKEEGGKGKSRKRGGKRDSERKREKRGGSG